MLDLLKKNNCAKVLNDNSNVHGNWSEAADWGGTVWFPEMQKAGLKFFAWIYSQSTLSKMAAHKSLDVMVGNITTQFFTDIYNAKEWLKILVKQCIYTHSEFHLNFSISFITGSVAGGVPTDASRAPIYDGMIFH